MPSLPPANRALIEGIQLACQQAGIGYQAYSDDWVIRLQKDGQTHLVYAHSFDCNSQAGDAVATDKVATYQLLAAGAVPAVPHYLLASQAWPAIDRTELEKLFKSESDLVIKPVLGRSGLAVAKVSSLKAAEQHIAAHPEAVGWAASPFVDVQREIRFVVFDGQLELTYEKIEPPVLNGLKMFNIGLGAKVKALALDEADNQLVDMALAAIRALGLRLAAVDVVVDEKGTAAVLEINSRFSLEHYAAASLDNRALAVALYAKIVRRLFGEG